MELTGLQNVAARYGVDQYRPLPLEASDLGAAGGFIGRRNFAGRADAN